MRRSFCFGTLLLTSTSAWLRYLRNPILLFDSVDQCRYAQTGYPFASFSAVGFAIGKLPVGDLADRLGLSFRGTKINRRSQFIVGRNGMALRRWAKRLSI
jgi:hypothetical protein